MHGAVEVTGGRVRGERRDGVWRFLGVPYGASPAGGRRWRAPDPPEPWDGVRDATAPGPVSPQTPAPPGMSLPGDPVVQDEDCLHLSLWTPDLDGARRPVMVWIHGGGFTGGTAGSVLYDGTWLAARGDVVVVTVNYRLGALGFLAHPALAGPDGGWANWGLLDQVAALRWIDHVGAFGGDPGCVTVFGESAGGMSVCALLAMEASQGLVHRAAVQSGPAYTFDGARAADAAAELAAVLGLAEVRRDILETVPARDLVNAVATMQARTPRPGELPLPLLPTVDGVTMRARPLDAVAAGAAAGVPLLIGTNRDELAYFTLWDPSAASMGEEKLLLRLARSAPDVDPLRVADRYRRSRTARDESVVPRDLWVAAGSDLVFRWPSLRLAAAHHHHEPRTFAYLFTWETPVLDGALGSCHALEVPFVFGSVRNPVVAAFSGGGSEADALSEAMAEAWLAFARDGDPSTPDRSWPRWEPDDRLTMVWGRAPAVERGPRDEELAAWEEVFPLARAPAAHP